MSDAMVEFRNVSKAYRSPKTNKVILRNFSGDVPARAQYRAPGRQRLGQVDA